MTPRSPHSGTRLLLDAVNVRSPGGVQLQLELARSAARRTPEGDELIFLQAEDETASVEVDGLRIVRMRRSPGWVGLSRWFARDLPRIAREQGADVVYSLSGILSRALCRDFATVNTINNMLPFSPEQMRHFALWSPDRIRLVLLQHAYVWSSRRADALVVPSRHALDAMKPFAGNLSERAFVAPNPVPDHVRYDPGRPPVHPYGGRPFFFYLSVVFWYKNHLNLIEGYRRALARDPGLPDLLMAGPPSDADYVRRIESAIRVGKLEEKARYLGKIPTEQIPGFLHHATINVFPSTCETNSFVQNEILGAHGVMACSSLAPMPEIAGDAAELFDPHDPDSIASVLLSLSRDEARRAELRRLAAARAATLTWDALGDVVWSAARAAIERRAVRDRSRR